MVLIAAMAGDSGAAAAEAFGSWGTLANQGVTGSR
jgi:hypothetical protein